MLGPEIRPLRDAHILAQKSHESTVLLNPNSGHYYTLDEVGGRVWELCDGSHRVADVVSAIHAEYDAPLQEIEADISDLLDDLARERLVIPSA